MTRILTTEGWLGLIEGAEPALMNLYSRGGQKENAIEMLMAKLEPREG
jgi:hypothetical protein